MGEWMELALHDKLLAALNDLKFKHPTPIQTAAIPVAIKRNNIIAAAQTGSGKTLAFGLPVVHNILKDMSNAKRKHLKSAHLVLDRTQRLAMCLILSPTRELAMQIREHIQAITKHTEVTLVALVGGMAEEKQLRQLKHRPHILVCTPGRLAALINDGKSEFLSRSVSSNLRYLVLDEADKLLQDRKFEDLLGIFQRLNAVSAKRAYENEDFTNVVDESQFQDIFKPMELEEFASMEDLQQNKKIKVEKNLEWHVDRQNEGLPDRKADRQVFITSATVTLTPQAKENGKRKRFQGISTEEGIEQLVQKLGMSFENFQMIDVNPKHQMVDSMKEERIECTDDDKDLHCYRFITSHPGRTIIFVNSVFCLRRVISLLHLLQVPSWAIHSQMPQRQRLKHLDRFKACPTGVAVCTDVLGRGVDIKDVSCGRTARAYTPGFVLSLISPGDKENYRKVMFSLDRKKGLPLMKVPVRELKEASHVINVATRLGKLTSKENKLNSENRWQARNASVLDMDDDGNEVDEPQPQSGKRRRSRGEKKDENWDEWAENKRFKADIAQLREELKQLLISRGVIQREDEEEKRQRLKARAARIKQAKLEQVAIATAAPEQKNKSSSKKTKKKPSRGKHTQAK